MDGDNYAATEGRVEYCVGGRWGTVCNYLWTLADVVVVCRQLGLNTFGRYNHIDSIRLSYTCVSDFVLLKEPKILDNVPQIKNLLSPIFLDGLNCRGNEASLSQCGHEPVVEYCSHSDDAGAVCTNIRGKTILCSN